MEEGTLISIVKSFGLVSLLALSIIVGLLPIKWYITLDRHEIKIN